MTTHCLAVTDGGIIAKFGRLSHPSWRLVHAIIAIFTYLLTELVKNEL